MTPDPRRRDAPGLPGRIARARAVLAFCCSRTGHGELGGWLQAAALVLAVLVTTRLLGPYLAARPLAASRRGSDRVFCSRWSAVIYRVLGVDP